MFDIKDRPGCITKAAMLELFAGSVAGTPMFKKSVDMKTVTADGEFDHFAVPTTDAMWIGFAVGMRCAERIAKLEAVTKAVDAQP